VNAAKATHLAVPVDLVQRIGKYLTKQPYEDVHEFLGELNGCQGLVLNGSDSQAESPGKPESPDTH